MAETLASNLEAVYNKWAEKGPYGSTGKPKTLQKDLPDYDRVIREGRNSWHEKFKDVGPPPQRPDSYQKRGRKKRTPSENHIFSQNSGISSNLASFKVTPVIMPQDERSRRPYMGRCCACMPTSKLEHHNESVEKEPLHNILRVHTMHKRNSLWTRTFYHTSYVLERNVSHEYPEVSLAALTSPRVIEAVQKSALQELGVDSPDGVDQKRLKTAIDAHRKHAKRAIKQMRAKISNALIRFTGWFLHKLLGRLYSSIVVHTGQLKVLDTVSKRDLPIIFLPTHQSHMDYILLTFILFNYDIRAPHVAAGDNLRIPIFGHLMRGLGGYFIRRKLDGRKGSKDFVYRALLHAYMEGLLKEGEFFEIFIEGGRTRTGKALYPKGGLLSVVVDSYLTGAIPDAYIAPVSFSYEKLIDGNFTSELRGLPKHQETFWRACSAIWHVIWGKFGNVRVDFGQPFSLKEYLTACQSQFTVQEDVPYSPEPMQRSFNSSQSLYSEMASDDHRLTVQTLALHVIHTCISLRAIMSTHLMAFLFLTKHRQGASLEKLSPDLEWLIYELRSRGRDVGFSGETHDVILHACELLGEHLVSVKAKEGIRKKRHQGDLNNNPAALFVQPVTLMHQAMELAYYANGVIPDFALGSILALGIIAELDAQDWPAMYNDEQKPSLKKSDLVAAATHLIHLLHVEFIIKPPCGSLDTVIDTAIDKLLSWEVISVDYESTTREIDWANRFSRSLDWRDSDDEDDNGYEADTIYKIETGRQAIVRLRFLHSVLAPLMETYYVVILEATFLATTPKTDPDFIRSTHNVLLDRVKNKVVTYVESANIVTVKTALQALKQLQLVETRKAPNSDVNELYTSNDSCEHLQHLLDLLVHFNPNPLGPPKSLLPLSA